MDNLDSALNVIEHSYKGTEWVKHKYIKKMEGRYHYPKKVPNKFKLDKLRRLNDSNREIATIETEQNTSDYSINKKISMKNISEKSLEAAKKSFQKVKTGKITDYLSDNKIIAAGQVVLAALPVSAGYLIDKSFKAIKKEWEDQETSFVMDFMN